MPEPRHRGRPRRRRLSRHRARRSPRLAAGRRRDLCRAGDRAARPATAAVVGVDAEARAARELDTLRDAGVDLLLVDLDEGPIFHNEETPTGRVQTVARRGPAGAIRSRCPSPGWRHAAGRSSRSPGRCPRPGSSAIPDRGRGRGRLAGLAAPTGRRASGSAAPIPTPNRAHRPGGPRRGQSRRRGRRRRASLALDRLAPSGRAPARHPRARGRPARDGRRRQAGRRRCGATCRRRPTARSTRPAPVTRSSGALLAATIRPSILGPGRGGRRGPALRGGGRIAGGRAGRARRRARPCGGHRPPGPGACPSGDPAERVEPGRDARPGRRGVRAFDGARRG